MKPRRTPPPCPAAGSSRAREEVLRVDYPDVLRQAAKVLRERAEDAVSAVGPASMQSVWASVHDEHDGETTVTSGDFHVGRVYTTQAGAYIATMHPGVGLALADLLDFTANEHEGDGPEGCWECVRWLTIARLILGSAS